MRPTVIADQRRRFYLAPKPPKVKEASWLATRPDERFFSARSLLWPNPALANRTRKRVAVQVFPIVPEPGSECCDFCTARPGLQKVIACFALDPGLPHASVLVLLPFNRTSLTQSARYGRVTTPLYVNGTTIVLSMYHWHSLRVRQHGEACYKPTVTRQQTRSIRPFAVVA